MSDEDVFFDVTVDGENVDVRAAVRAGLQRPHLRVQF
jgi:hypothetical protein